MSPTVSISGSWTLRSVYRLARNDSEAATPPAGQKSASANHSGITTALSVTRRPPPLTSILFKGTSGSSYRRYRHLPHPGLRLFSLTRAQDKVLCSVPPGRALYTAPTRSPELICAPVCSTRSSVLKWALLCSAAPACAQIPNHFMAEDMISIHPKRYVILSSGRRYGRDVLSLSLVSCEGIWDRKGMPLAGLSLLEKAVLSAPYRRTG